MNIDLRDYFAGQALQGMLASGNDHYNGSTDYKDYSGLAYGYADAMIAEREKNMPKEEAKDSICRGCGKCIH